MFCIVMECDLGCLRIRICFIGHHAAAVVIFLQVDGIGATDNQPQAASFFDTPREECKAVKGILIDLTRND